MMLLAFVRWCILLNLLYHQRFTLGQDSEDEPVSLKDSWTPPLSTRGRYVVDADGIRFRFVGGNWHGASGTYESTTGGSYDDPKNHHAGELAYQTVLGLDRKPIDDIVSDFLAIGINTVRLPWSNEMIHSKKIVPDAALKANPQLRNMTPLQIYDATIKALTKRGIAVILNNHTVKSIWCCGLDVNARWNIEQTQEQWITDWEFMVRRYKNDTRVIGAELYNEPRGNIVTDPVWGGGGKLDWFSATLEAGTRIQKNANADILIIIPGINYVGVPLKGVTHYRPELQPVARLSHTLPNPNKLVYSAHFYGYTGPNATGLTAPGIVQDPLYADLTPTELNNTFYTLAQYVADQDWNRQHHYTRPVFISEFGVGGRNEFSQRYRDWWGNFTSFLYYADADFALWPLVGWHENGQGDLWAMNAYDVNGSRLGIMDPGDWRLPALAQLINDTSGELWTMASEALEKETFRMLAPAWGNQQTSQVVLNSNTALIPGTHKASCPDGLRLHGLSRAIDPKALCTDITFGREFWAFNDSSSAEIKIVKEINVNKTDQGLPTNDTDWAPGYSTLTCDEEHHVIGYTYSKTNSTNKDDQGTSRFASILCVPHTVSTDLLEKFGRTFSPPKRRTVYFDKGSSTDADIHGVWDEATGGVNLGRCLDIETLVGVAFTPLNTTASGDPLIGGLGMETPTNSTDPATLNNGTDSKSAGLVAALRCEGYDGIERQDEYSSATRRAALARKVSDKGRGQVAFHALMTTTSTVAAALTTTAVVVLL